MSTQQIAIQVSNRELCSKGGVAKLRASGVIPGVIYGKGKSQAISIATQNLPKGHTRSKLVKLSLDGKDLLAFMRDVQFDVLTDGVTHIDFQSVSADEVVKIKIPVEYLGLTKEQEKVGSFKTLLRSLEVVASASKIPEVIQVDVSGLAVDQSVHAADVNLPAGVKLKSTKNLALASLVKL